MPGRRHGMGRRRRGVLRHQARRREGERGTARPGAQPEVHERGRLVPLRASHTGRAQCVEPIPDSADRRRPPLHQPLTWPANRSNGRDMSVAQEMADRLDGKNVVVQVKVDTGGAETKLAAVAASEDRVGGSSKGASSGLTSVESAARKLADASSVANIAQLRLSEVQSSGTAKASSLASANQSVTKTQRDLSDLMKSSTPEVIRAADAMKQVDV